jgi:hypothetical protein
VAGKEITRADLRRALAANALTKPVNVLVPAGVGLAAVVIGVWWLWIVALVVFAVLCAQTFFDEDEAKRVGDRAYGRQAPAGRRVDPRKLAPPIGAQLDAALTEEKRIRAAIESAALPFSDLGPEVAALVGEMERTASRAELVYEYLEGIYPGRIEARLRELRAAQGPEPDDPARTTADALDEQLAAYHEMRKQVERYFAEMEQTVAALSTIHAQVVRMGVTADAGGEEELTGRVRDLRGKVTALTEGIAEAYEEAPDTPGQSSGSG